MWLPWPAVSWHVGFAAAGVGMVLGLVQYLAGRKYLRRGRRAARRPRLTGSTDARQKTQAVRWIGVLGAAVALLGLGALTGAIPVTVIQIADAAGYGLLALTVDSSHGCSFPVMDRLERNRCYGDLRSVPGIRAVLGRIRAGRVDAQPVRRSKHSELGFRLGLSKQLVSVVESAVHHCFRADVHGSGSISPGGARNRQAVRSSASDSCWWAPDSPSWFPAAIIGQNGGLVSPMWLTVTYLLHTWGELALSPVGLSAMTNAGAGPDGGLVRESGFWVFQRVTTSVGVSAGCTNRSRCRPVRARCRVCNRRGAG